METIVQRAMGVKVHTPNPNGYGLDSQGREILPMANQDGTSRGFNHQKAAPVIVDPDDFGNRIVFDPSKLTPEQGSALATAPAGHDEIVARLSALSTLQKQATAAPAPAPAVVAPVAIPAANPGVPAMTQFPAPLTQLPAALPANFGAPLPGVTPPPMVPVPQPVPEAPAAPVAAPVAAPPQLSPLHDPGLQAVLQGQSAALGQLAQQMNQVVQVVTTLQSRPADPPVSPPDTPHVVPKPPEMGEVPRAVKSAVRGELEELREIAIKDDYSLPIDLRKAAVPPTIDVYFNLGDNVGTWATKYHHVSVTPDALVLYLDTRYDSTNQFQPADRQQPFEVEIPSLDKKWFVLSRRLRDSFGPIDWLMLLIVPPEVVNQANEG